MCMKTRDCLHLHPIFPRTTLSSSQHSSSCHRPNRITNGPSVRAPPPPPPLPHSTLPVPLCPAFLILHFHGPTLRPPPPMPPFLFQARVSGSRRPTFALYPNGNSTLSAAHAAVDNIDASWPHSVLRLQYLGFPHSFPLAIAMAIPSYIANVSARVVDTRVLGLLCLFIFDPMMTFYRDEKRSTAIQGNVRVNTTGVFFVVSSFLSSPYFSQDKPLFFSRCQNLLTKLRRRRHISAQVSNWCFRMSLRWRGRRFGLVSFVSFFRHMHPPVSQIGGLGFFSWRAVLFIPFFLFSPGSPGMGHST